MTTTFVAKRIRFRNGERLSVLARPNGLPVHEATLYLNRYRKKGRAANTLHSVCRALALLYQELSSKEIDLLQRLREGRFLTVPEITSLADAAQYWAADASLDEPDSSPNVIDIKRIRMRRKASEREARSVVKSTLANRLRYIANYLDFLVGYFSVSLPAGQKSTLNQESESALTALRAEIPRVSRRAKLGAREGLSEEDEARLIETVHPDSPNNPWRRPFVRKRNWLIVALLFATGMRQGELRGLQIADLNPREPKLRIVRRADAPEDPRLIQPNAKTNDRELELTPALMRKVWSYINEDRHKIKAARKHPHLIVSDDGAPISSQAIDKIFLQLRKACPGLPVTLTSHVSRHTWNERFSEQADRMQLSEATEQRARNEQQGWTADSDTARIYTRRHATRKGRQIALKIQEKLDVTSQ